MAKAYSTDLRVRVLADYDDGLRVVDVARKYRVGEWWVYKLRRQRRETGCIEPRRGRSGPKPKLAAAQRERLRQIVRECPDATLQELREKLGLSVCLMTVWRALRQLGLSLKKSAPRRRTTTAGRGRTSSVLARGAAGTGSGKACFSR